MASMFRVGVRGDLSGLKVAQRGAGRGAGAGAAVLLAATLGAATSWHGRACECTHADMSGGDFCTSALDERKEMGMGLTPDGGLHTQDEEEEALAGGFTMEIEHSSYL